MIEEDGIISAHLLERPSHRIQRKRRRTGREFKLDAVVDGYKIKDVMLDFRSDVHILPKKSWEAMGKPKPVYSPI